MARRETPGQFAGYWKIDTMECWARDYIDLVVPGFIHFEEELLGSFQFGTVGGWLDCRVRTEGEGSALEWSWEGRSDNDPGCGRGVARIEGERLVGHLYIHNGDDSSFVAVRLAKGEPRSIRPRLSS